MYQTPLEVNQSLCASQTPKWRPVGIQLGLPTSTLDHIEENTAGKVDQIFEKVFTTWEQNHTSSYTWKTIIDAIKSAAVGEKKLAKSLSENL